MNKISTFLLKRLLLLLALAAAMPSMADVTVTISPDNYEYLSYHIVKDGVVAQGMYAPYSEDNFYVPTQASGESGVVKIVSTTQKIKKIQFVPTADNAGTLTQQGAAGSMSGNTWECGTDGAQNSVEFAVGDENYKIQNVVVTLDESQPVQGALGFEPREVTMVMQDFATIPTSFVHPTLTYTADLVQSNTYYASGNGWFQYSYPSNVNSFTFYGADHYSVDATETGLMYAAYRTESGDVEFASFRLTADFSQVAWIQCLNFAHEGYGWGSGRLTAGDEVQLSPMLLTKGGIVEGAEFSYSVGDRGIAAVDANGIVTALAAGETTLTITSPATATHQAATYVIELTVAQKLDGNEYLVVGSSSEINANGKYVFVSAVLNEDDPDNPANYYAMGHLADGVLAGQVMNDKVWTASQNGLIVINSDAVNVFSLEPASNGWLMKSDNDGYYSLTVTDGVAVIGKVQSESEATPVYVDMFNNVMLIAIEQDGVYYDLALVDGNFTLVQEVEDEYPVGLLFARYETGEAADLTQPLTLEQILNSKYAIFATSDERPLMLVEDDLTVEHVLYDDYNETYVLFAKDDNKSVSRDENVNNYYDYIARSTSFSNDDQSNWINIEVPAKLIGNLVEDSYYNPETLETFPFKLSGKMLVELGSKLGLMANRISVTAQLPIVCQDDLAAAQATVNTFIGPNFNRDREWKGVSTGRDYFFVSPKQGEVANITWVKLTYDSEINEFVLYTPETQQVTNPNTNETRTVNSDGLTGQFVMRPDFLTAEGQDLIFGDETNVGAVDQEVTLNLKAWIVYSSNPFYYGNDAKAPQQGPRRSTVVNPDYGNPNFATDMYYVYPFSVSVDDIATAVTTVEHDSPVVSTTYIDLQGRQSSTPHQGINIVVKRHANGTTTATKQLVR